MNKIKEILLTKGKVAIVDDEDFGYLSQWKWHATKQRNSFYANRNIKKIGGGFIVITMHQELMGKMSGYVIDHINGNGLDNRRENLRYVTIRQNGQNLHISKSSKYPGAYWHNRDKKWKAQMQINGERKDLGHFANELDAFEAYKKAVEELTGQKVISKHLFEKVN